MTRVSRSIAFTGAVAVLAAGVGCGQPAKQGAPIAPSGANGHANAQAVGDKRALYERDCSKGRGNICYLLGGNYERGGDTPWGFFPQDFGKAVEAYGHGCALGDVDSCGAAARLMIHGKPTLRLPDGVALAEATCERGHADSCGLFGMAQIVGATGLSGYEDGFAHLERGCKNGGRAACAYLNGFRTKRFASSHRPSSAFGLRFKASPQEMERWCTAHGHGADGDDRSVQCRNADGFVPFMGFFKNGELSSLIAATKLSGNANAWALALRQSVDRLTDLYGTPSEVVVRGSTCASRALAEQVACLEDGQIRLKADWYWESGAAVTVGVEFGPHGEAVLLVNTAQNVARPTLQ